MFVRLRKNSRKTSEGRPLVRLRVNSCVSVECVDDRHDKYFIND